MCYLTEDPSANFQVRPYQVNPRFNPVCIRAAYLHTVICTTDKVGFSTCKYMRRPTELLVPFLLTLGPVWLLLFAKSDLVGFKLAGFIGAIAFSVGLILMLSMVYTLRRKIETLESEIESLTHQSEIE